MRLALALCLVLVSTAGFSQMTGGGSQPASGPSREKSEGNPNKLGTFHFGLANPMGKFKENSLNVPYNEAVGAKPGMYLAFDRHSYFSNNTDNPLAFGLSYSFGLNWNGVNWEKWVAGTTEFTGTPFINTYFKLGPVATYKINDDMSVDGFFRLGVGVGISGSGTWSGSTSSGDYQEFWSETPGVGFVYGLGTNYRWKNLMATFQINPAKYTFTYYSDGPDADYKVPMSTFWLGVGFVFKKGASL